MTTVLIAYYSRRGQNYVAGDIVDLAVGNTEVVAHMIASATGGDLFEIRTVKPYPAGYNECIEVARKELREHARPGLVDEGPDLSAYDVVFLGYPNWWGTPPMAVFTFLEAHEWAGKTVIPFCTHEGSGMGRSERDIEAACRDATVVTGLPLVGSQVHGSADAVRQWIETTAIDFSADRG